MDISNLTPELMP